MVCSRNLCVSCACETPKRNLTVPFLPCFARSVCCAAVQGVVSPAGDDTGHRRRSSVPADGPLAREACRRGPDIPRPGEAFESFERHAVVVFVVRVSLCWCNHVALWCVVRLWCGIDRAWLLRWVTGRADSLLLRFSLCGCTPVSASF